MGNITHTNAFQQTAFQIIGTLTRPIGKIDYDFLGRIPVGSLRVITIKPVKNRRVE